VPLLSLVILPSPHPSVAREQAISSAVRSFMARGYPPNAFAAMENWRTEKPRRVVDGARESMILTWLSSWLCLFLGRRLTS
jgi:hypothetical protein